MYFINQLIVFLIVKHTLLTYAEVRYFISWFRLIFIFIQLSLSSSYEMFHSALLTGWVLIAELNAFTPTVGISG